MGDARGAGCYAVWEFKARLAFVALASGSSVTSDSDHVLPLPCLTSPLEEASPPRLLHHLAPITRPTKPRNTPQHPTQPLPHSPSSATSVLGVRVSAATCTLINIVAYSAINGLLVFVFLYRPFVWPDGSVARFMW